MCLRFCEEIPIGAGGGGEWRRKKITGGLVAGARSKRQGLVTMENHGKNWEFSGDWIRVIHGVLQVQAWSVGAAVDTVRTHRLFSS